MSTNTLDAKTQKSSLKAVYNAKGHSRLDLRDIAMSDLGISKTTWGRWMLGERPMRKYEREYIAAAFGFAVAELYPETSNVSK